MSIQDLLVIGLTGVALAAVGYALYIRFRVKRFTRERYAFAFLANSTALFVTVVTTLLAKPPWIALADLFHHWLPNIIPQPAQANWSERIFVILGFIAVVWLQYRVLQHWSGGRSVRQAEVERNKEQLSALDGALRKAGGGSAVSPHRRCLTGPLIVNSTLSSSHPRTPSPGGIRHGSWSSSAGPACASNDWHEREEVWVGRNLRTDCLAAVLM